MRAVAARLEAVPMALYNHFATKELLVDALLDRVLSRFEPAPATGDWIADLRRFAHAHRRLLATHPWAVAPLFTQPNPGLGAVRIGEHALGILRRGGLSNDRSVAAFSGLIAINYGWSSFTAARDLDPEGPSHDVAAMLRMLPREQFPLTVDVAEEMGAHGSDAHYELVLDSFLGGLGERRERRSGAPPRPALWDAAEVRPTLFEFAGGEPAFLALAAAHHARCLADPELNHPFSHPDQHPQHVERLAAYWAEVLGGPPGYSQSSGDQSGVLRMHAGNGDMGDLGERFVRCFDAALDDAQLPADPEFRAALHAYMTWAVDEVLSYSAEDAVVAPGAAMPRWDWEGLET